MPFYYVHNEPRSYAERLDPAAEWGFTELKDLSIRYNSDYLSNTSSWDNSAGRLFRSFYLGHRLTTESDDAQGFSKSKYIGFNPLVSKDQVRALLEKDDYTWGELFEEIRKRRYFTEFRRYLTKLPFRIIPNSPYKTMKELRALSRVATKTEITDADLYNKSRDPELHPCFQDLAYEINEDITEACYAFDNPDLYYPGIDEGIEPVPDSHVDTVIRALQRELLRELRGPEPNTFHYGSTSPIHALPAAPLEQLPWRIKRALVERRRYRFTVQYGITHDVWKSGVFNFWKIAEDSEWRPRRHTRLRIKNGLV